MYYYRGGVFLEGGRNTHTNSNKRNKQEHRKRYCGLHIQKWKMYHCTELSFLSINESSLRKNPVGYNPLFFFFSPILYIDLTHFPNMFPKQFCLHGWKGYNCWTICSAQLCKSIVFHWLFSATEIFCVCLHNFR